MILVIMSPLSFITFKFGFSIFSLVCLAKVLSILFIFSKSQLFVLVLFFSNFTVIYIIYFCSSKDMTNLDSMFKSRDITLPTKVHLVKGMVFPVVMYGCDSWTVKKTEHRRMMLLNCGVGEDSWESLGLQGDPTSPFWRRSALGFLWKEWC